MTHGPEFAADRGRVREMAQVLKRSTSGLEDASGGAPEMPEVTSSAEHVGTTLSEISKTIAGLIHGVDTTAEKIDAADAGYGEVDAGAAERLNSQSAGPGNG